MSPKRWLYSREFKLEAIRLIETSGKTILDIETDLGIPHGLLNKWRRSLKREGNDAFRDQGQLKAANDQLRQLRQENELLRQEREILKKALAIPSTLRLRSGEPSLRTGFMRSQR